MTRLRPMARAIMPAALIAISLLAPGVLRAAPQSAKSKAPAKTRVQKAPARTPVHNAKAKKVTRKVVRRRVRYRRRRGPARPSSSRIEQIQQALARTGFYQGDPSGTWNSKTIQAMKSFQQAHGLAPTGKIDATSLQQLGLGSDIAGVAPPRPAIATADANPSGTGGE